MNEPNKEESMPSEDILPSIILEAFISYDMFEKVWARCQMLSENVLLTLKEYEGTKVVYKKLVINICIHYRLKLTAYIFFSFTLYPQYNKVGRGNLLLFLVLPVR